MNDDQVTDRVERVRARLAEDEEVAQSTRKNEQFVYGTDRWFASHNNAITSMAPHRAVAEVAAKRKLLDLATAMLETFPADEAARLLLHQSAEEILRQLAEPYTDQGGQES